MDDGSCVDFGGLVAEAQKGPRPPATRARLIGYLGAIVAAASVAPAGEELPTVVPCRKRPDKQPCQESILVHRQQVPPQLRWRCPACGDAGQIENWEATQWNFEPDLAPSSREEPRMTVRLEGRDLGRLLDELIDQRPALAVLHLARPTSDGWKLRLTYRQLEAVVNGAADAAEGGLPAERDFALYMAVSPFSTALEECDECEEGSHVVVNAADELEYEPRLLFPPARQASTRAPRARRPPHTIYRIRVQLRGVRPPVWRRLDVPSDLTIRHLHHLLQGAFGWQFSGPFLVRDTTGRTVADLGYDHPVLGEHFEDAGVVLLRDLAQLPGARLTYLYKFEFEPDGWEHDVEVESITPGSIDVPRLLAGKRACPPESARGPADYAQKLELLGTIQGGPRKVRTTLGAGFEGYDPEVFDLEEVQCRIEELRVPYR